MKTTNYKLSSSFYTLWLSSMLSVSILLPQLLNAQGGVGIGIDNPHQSAILHIQPPNGINKGLLIPRLTTAQINAISPAVEGLLAYDMTSFTLKVYTQGLWTNVGAPAGTIVMWSGSTASIPVGWTLCDGKPGTPDLRERFIVGAADDTDNLSVGGIPYAPGEVGGSNAVALTPQQLPSHTHSFDVLSGNAGRHSHGMTLHDDNGGDHYRVRSAGGGGPRATYRGWTETQSTQGSNSLTTQLGIAIYDLAHPVDGLADPTDDGDIKPEGQHRHRVNGTTSSIGSGQAHENRPPYYALAFIMKL
jgi:microcystin-dependent protein